MGGKHRKPAPTGKVAVYCMTGILLLGGSFVTAYGVVPLLSTTVIPSQLEDGYPTSVPTSTVPTLGQLVPPLAPGQEKDSGGTSTLPQALPSPEDGSQGDAGSTEPQDPIPPIQPPQPPPADAAQGNSEAPPVADVDPETDRIEETQASPPIARALPRSICLPVGGIGLRSNAALATAEIVSEFDFDGTLIGRGGRERVSDHPDGLASDFLTTDVRLGNAIRDYALKNKARLGIKYVIWRQRIYFNPGAGRAMEDRGSDTQNHYDHVHLSFVSNPGNDFAPRCD